MAGNRNEGLRRGRKGGWKKPINSTFMSVTAADSWGSVLPGTPTELCRMCFRIATLKHGTGGIYPLILALLSGTLFQVH